MAEKKIRITKTMRFEDIRSILNGETPAHGTTHEDALSFIENEIALLSRKNKGGTDRKMTATQQANEGYKDLILDFLALMPDGATCTEILKGVHELNDFNNQKVSALLRQLKLSGRVTSSEVKGKTIFSLA